MPKAHRLYALFCLIALAAFTYANLNGYALRGQSQPRDSHSAYAARFHK